ncbi:MAG TPA: TIGR03557 family F420-dependent LLM class oxidoreductase [Caldilineaceae bacterium]|nr:TIGR03557 family F420-dependent LLM class oxidoreductase [Caldilineaceae bacterium]
MNGLKELGYAMSSEEHPPNDLVRHAARAEEAGFRFALISDHFHPWVSEQGQAPFVWSVMGGIAHATSKLRLGTGVTCPLIRTHPAIIAHAAATMGAMMPGRFFLGVGTGENLNEHVTGERWPPYDIRLAMLEEAVEIMRRLWTGETVSHWGEFYTVEDAKLFTRPDAPVDIYVAAAGPTSAEAAARVGDGLISTSPEAKLIQSFEEAGGRNKPRYGKFTVCWAASQEEAKRTVRKIWPTSALGGELTQELRTVPHFEQATKRFTEEDTAQGMVLGANPEEHIQGIQKFIDAGFDYVYVHQIGHDQEGFFKFYEREVMPHFQRSIEMSR